ncbi:hypothetical protein [Sphingomonas sp. LHG3406-1]|uniref:hypothetical protein n=1 Tax=Sphingomonas sp. LHG3406-1 TaxID=2804617 RepID=UPI002609836A|nr:hypothetical protein [Sphingomonas sp. LHG3406-1]
MLALALASACAPRGPTVIDGSSEKQFEETSSLARDDLPIADRLDYDRALAGVPARRYAHSDHEGLRRTTFDGMTAAEVVQDFRRRQR